MTIDPNRLTEILDKVGGYKPLSAPSLRRINELGLELERAEAPTTIALSMLGGALAALTQVLSREEIEEIVIMMVRAMYGDVDPNQLNKLHDAQQKARNQLSDALGVPAATLPKLPFERS